MCVWIINFVELYNIYCNDLCIYIYFLIRTALLHAKAIIRHQSEIDVAGTLCHPFGFRADLSLRVLCIQRFSLKLVTIFELIDE